jgi:hypothetical protein
MATRARNRANTGAPTRSRCPASSGPSTERTRTYPLITISTHMVSAHRIMKAAPLMEPLSG